MPPRRPRPRTRATSGAMHWLVGSEEPKILGSKLPTKRQVLKFLLYLMNNKKMSAHSSARETSKVVLQFWNKANIPVKPSQHCVKAIEKLHSSYMLVKKNRFKNSTSPAQAARAKRFEADLDRLLDIAHQDAESLITIKEDLDFLKAQRETERRGSMLNARDYKLAMKKANQETRRLHAERRKREEILRRSREQRVLVPRDEEMSDSECTPDTEYVHKGPLPNGQRKRKRGEKVMSGKLLGMLDRTKLSCRKGAAVTLAAYGDKGAHMTMSKSSLHRERVKFRREEGEKIDAAMENTEELGEILTLHWDGKLLPDLAGYEKVDRLPVLVSGGGKEILLGVPKISSGTGLNQANAATYLVKRYKLGGKIVFIVFDTTSSNTGTGKGACQHIEKILGLENFLIWLACRHHVYEIILKDVFILCLGPLKGATSALFERFRAQWNEIDRTQYRVFSDFIVLPQDERLLIIEFCQTQLKDHQPRGDYKKLLEMSVVFLGGTLDKEVFGASGALNDARWMARGIYCLSMYMFADQLKLTKREEKGVERVCLFVVKIYIQFWFTCQVARWAPSDDLELIKLLREYTKKDKQVGEKALNAIGRHLWYLSEELVALALFDERLTAETKVKMVENLQRAGDPRPPHRLPLNTKLKILDVAERNLEDFVTSSTLNFFQKARLPHAFLSKHPSEWTLDQDFLKCLEIVKTLRVVNDTAERGVALVKEYNAAGLTKSEDDFQSILKIVNKHRQVLQKLTKREILNA